MEIFLCQVHVSFVCYLPCVNERLHQYHEKNPNCLWVASKPRCSFPKFCDVVTLAMVHKQPIWLQVRRSKPKWQCEEEIYQSEALTSGYHIGHTFDLSANRRKTHCESKYDKNTTIKTKSSVQIQIGLNIHFEEASLKG